MSSPTGPSPSVVAFVSSPSTRTLLRSCGFTTLDQFLSTEPSRLARELKIDVQRVMEIVKEVEAASETTSSMRLAPTSLATLLKAKRVERTVNGTVLRGITSFSRAIDALFDGVGFPIDEVTEVCGEPGCGKTQLCMQLAVNASMRTLVGGVEGETLYIDTEGSFSPHRCFAMANALASHLSTSKKRKRSTDSGDSTEARRILRGIHVVRIHDRVAQLALLHTLVRLFKHARGNESDFDSNSPKDDALKNLVPKLRLVVLDSVAFHYRTGGDLDFASRSRLLHRHARLLNELAACGVAVVVTNHVTTRFRRIDRSKSAFGDSSEAYFVPALGESWSHAVTNRVLVSKTSDTTTTRYTTDARSQTTFVRTVRLDKSPSRPAAEGVFSVTEVGIRDVKRTTKQS